MLPELQPHIAAAQRAARFRRQLQDAIAGRLAPADAMALVTAHADIPPAPARMRLIAWEDLMVARGHRIDARRMRFEIALRELGSATVESLAPIPTRADVDHRVTELEYLERARDRLDMPAGEVEP